MAKKISTAKPATKKAAAPKKIATKKAAVKKASSKKIVSEKSNSNESKIKKGKATSAKTVELLHDVIVQSAQDSKAKDIVCLDLRNIKDSVADYFIVCTGDVNVHVKSIADNVEVDVLKKVKEKVWHSEGFENMEWVIMDFVNVVLHVFKPQTRDFYRLEDLWSDAEKKIFS